MKSKLWRFVPVLLILLAGLVVWFQERQTPPASEAVRRTLPCVDLQKGCRIELDGRRVEIWFKGVPKPLQPFQVLVQAPGADKVQARFTMEGMDMGFNLYNFRAGADGLFEARITLPVCVTGRRDWVMELSVGGSRLAVPFVTDL